VGRLDAKAHRQEGLFEVIGIWLEADVVAAPALVAGIASAIEECAAWHGTPRIAIGRSQPKALATLIRTALED